MKGRKTFKKVLHRGTRIFVDWVCSSVVESLSSMNKALGLIPRTAKTNNPPPKKGYEIIFSIAHSWKQLTFHNKREGKLFHVHTVE